MSSAVESLKTMAALIKFADPDPARSADVLMMPAAIELLGYHEPGDGGGGLFHWEGDTVSDADNSMLVATYANKPVTPPEKERTGCYKRQLNEPISVKWFGAMGKFDSSTGRGKDDTDSIQAALSTKHSVYIPAGNYKISKTLKFFTSQQIYGDSMSWSGRGTIITIDGAMPVFQAATKDSKNTKFVHIHDLSVWNKVPRRDTGSIAIDYTNVGYSQISRLSLRYHECGILGGEDLPPTERGAYYNEIFSSEIASCNNGIRLIDAGNAYHIYGGRIVGNNIGIYLAHVSGNHISSSFEQNGLAIQFAAGASKCSVTSSYFEGNGKDPKLVPPHGAIHFDWGANFNVESANLFANIEDIVLDNDGSNISLSPRVVGTPAMATGIGSGINLIPNGSFEFDTNGDGLADSWVMASGIPTGTQLALDTAVRKFDNRSQKLTIASTGTSQRCLQLDVAVTSGQRYVFSGWTYVSRPNVFSIHIGDSLSNSNYYNSGKLASVDIWQFHRISFVPAHHSVTVYIFEFEVGPGTSDRSIWLDGFKLETGILPTGF